MFDFSCSVDSLPVSILLRLFRRRSLNKICSCFSGVFFTLSDLVAIWQPCFCRLQQKFCTISKQETNNLTLFPLPPQLACPIE